MGPGSLTGDRPRFTAPVNGCSSRDANGTFVYVPLGTILDLKYPGCGWDFNHPEVNPHKAGWARTPQGWKVAVYLHFENYGKPNCGARGE